MKTDSQTLIDSIKSTKQVEEKTMRHSVAQIKEQVDNKNVDKIDWVCSKDMTADMFTKKNVKQEKIRYFQTNGERRTHPCNCKRKSN